MEGDEHSIHSLNNYSYRNLQQIAKAMNLPCNVKKVYLIKMIHAKKRSSLTELENIVNNVKLERKKMQDVRNALKKRFKLQADEITSTCSTNQSPSIMCTPKRHGQFLVRYSPETSKSALKYYTKSTPTMKTYSSPKRALGSDRVLRSSNATKFKTVRQPRSILNPIYSSSNLTRVQSCKSASTQVNLVSQKNSDARCIPKIYGSDGMLWNERANQSKSMPKVYLRRNDKVVSYSRDLESIPSQPQRQRTLSGIYPLEPQEQKKYNVEYIKSLTFRRSDGKFSKIKALVQKPLTKTPQTSNQPQLMQKNVLVSIQDIIDTSIDTQTFIHASQENSDIDQVNLPDSQYFTPMKLDQVRYKPRNSLEEEIYDYKENYEKCHQYYHKKIRADKVRYQRLSLQKETSCEELPNINKAFSRFNNHHESQSIYVQDNDKNPNINSTEHLPQCSNTETIKTSKSNILESFYNIRNEYMNSFPMPAVLTTSSTKTVYTTPIMATACMQSTSHASNDQALCEQDNEHINEIPDISTAVDQQQMPYYNYGGINVSESSFTVEDSLGANVTIPEMVEDALEIISQDGDYMERIGMDIRMQCILCSWAGPKIVLEYHIRKEHRCSIEPQAGGAFSARCAGGARRVLEVAGALYVLAAHTQRHLFRANLWMLSSETDTKYASITIYNKLTGEPHVWQGEIPPLPLSLPYDDVNGLEINMLSTNQVLNSNLNVVNKVSPTEYVVGCPLNEVKVTAFIKIW